MRLSNVFTEERQHLPLLLLLKFETIRQGVLRLDQLVLLREEVHVVITVSRRFVNQISRVANLCLHLVEALLNLPSLVSQLEEGFFYLDGGK